MARATASSDRAASRSRSAGSAASKSRSRSRSGSVVDETKATKNGDGDAMDLDDSQDKRHSPSATKDKSADAAMNPSKVFSLRVDNLTRNVNADHLSEIFGKFGAVVSVNLMCERVSKAPRGFAFVGFKTQRDAEKAQDHMHDGWLDGKKVRVRFAKDDDQRRSRSRSRSAGRNNNNGSGNKRNGNQNANNSSAASGRRGRENMPRNKRSLSPRGRRGSLASPPRTSNRQSVVRLSAVVAGEAFGALLLRSAVAVAVH